MVLRSAPGRQHVLGNGEIEVGVFGIAAKSRVHHIAQGPPTTDIRVVV